MRAHWASLRVSSGLRGSSQGNRDGEADQSSEDGGEAYNPISGAGGPLLPNGKRFPPSVAAAVFLLAGSV